MLMAVLIGVFTTLKQQLETAKIEEVKESEYVIILDTPDIPLYPDKPKKKLIVVLVGLLGLGIGIMVAFIIEYTKNANSEQRKKMGEIKRISIDSARLFAPKKFIKT